MRRARKDFLPKVGEKMYYRAEYDKQIHEATCYEIEKKEGYETMYYTTPKNKACRGFVSEDALLDPLSKQVQNFIHRDFKKYEAKFEEAWREYREERGEGAITVNIKDLAKHFFELGLNIR